MSADPIIVYDWPVSPFCMKVRAVLEHKGLAYERKPAIPNLWRVYQRGGVGKVPALEIAGRFYVDSTDISHELERRFPTPSIFPSAPAERALCHLLEDWSDEALYFFGLYYHWREPAGQRQAAAYFAKTMLGRLFFRPYLSRIEGQLRGQGLGRKSPEHVRADLERNLDAIEQRLEGKEYLLGDGPYLCDFALASQLKYLTRAAALRTALAQRPHANAFLQRCTQVHF